MFLIFAQYCEEIGSVSYTLLLEKYYILSFLQQQITTNNQQPFYSLSIFSLFLKSFKGTDVPTQETSITFTVLYFHHVLPRLIPKK